MCRTSKPVIRIKEPYRNMGWSWGLEHPLIWGEVPGFGWCVWDRHTGVITDILGNDKNQHGYDHAKNRAMGRSKPESYGWVEP